MIPFARGEESNLLFLEMNLLASFNFRFYKET